MVPPMATLGLQVGEGSLETIIGNRSKVSQDTWVTPAISRFKSRLYMMGYYWLKSLKCHILFVELDSSAMVKLML